MTIQELIGLACEKDGHFKEKIEYWLYQRKKDPGSEWMIDNLVDILGREFVEKSIKDQIEKSK